MAVESIKLPGQPEPDPHLSMGEALVTQQKRQRLFQTIKIGVVWVVLIIFIILALLQFNFDPSYVFKHFGFVLLGLPITVGVSLASIFFATILALIGAVARLSKNSIALGISGFYVSIIRGTPLLIQIYIIYLGLPQIGQTLVQKGFPQVGHLFILTALQSGILALSLNYGAYMTEIFRAGIQSISGGQREAAESIGMNRMQILRRVILPQAVRVIIPDIANQFIAMQKDSALVSYMGIWEMTYRANRFARQDSKFMEMFIIAAVLYWLLTIISSWLEGLLEKRMRHGYER